MNTENPTNIPFAVLLERAINKVGLVALADKCDVRYQQLRKWQKNGRLPRTCYTGEKRYHEIIAEATNHEITEEQLLRIHEHKKTNAA